MRASCRRSSSIWNRLRNPDGVYARLRLAIAKSEIASRIPLRFPRSAANSAIYSAAGNTHATSTYGGSAANSSAAPDDCAATVNSTTTVVGASTAILIVRVTIATAVNDGSPPDGRPTAIRCRAASPHGATAICYAAVRCCGACASCARRKGVSGKTRDPECADCSERNDSTI